jgi:hypothetical protein
MPHDCWRLDTHKVRLIISGIHSRDSFNPGWLRKLKDHSGYANNHHTDVIVLVSCIVTICVHCDNQIVICAIYHRFNLQSIMTCVQHKFHDSLLLPIFIVLHSWCQVLNVCPSSIATCQYLIGTMSDPQDLPTHSSHLCFVSKFFVQALLESYMLVDSLRPCHISFPNSWSKRLTEPHFCLVLVDKNVATQVTCEIVFDLCSKTPHDDMRYCVLHRFSVTNAVTMVNI